MAINERAMNGYLAEAMESQAPPRYQVVAENQGQAPTGRNHPRHSGLHALQPPVHH